MVNKGFKSRGARQIANKLNNKIFEIPTGISVGRTNSIRLKDTNQSIDDITKALNVFEESNINNAYYELNISCPNLKGKIDFYSEKKLHSLLSSIDKLNIKKPLFVKMPIHLSDRKIKELLESVSKSKAAGVIFGNLQKNRKHKDLHAEEVARYKKGYFSGKPTFDRSNELISLTYQNYKDRLVIIGCGGVFTPEDAFEKITRGASLVQLITGLIFNGPQLVNEINFGLEEILEKKGLQNIVEAVGSRYS
jgi:dihydroorotate dehydrogenase